MIQMYNVKNCNICPRKCGADRTCGTGYCGQGAEIKIARAAPHYWEEPCISGERGSGTVFFSGCSLRCVYCQNADIAHGGFGKEISCERLCEIFFELAEKGVHNINLVTPTHFTPQIREAIIMAKSRGFLLPFVYNCGGYESVETLRTLEGLIDIYLTDFKYMSSARAKKYSAAENYPETAKAATAEMVRQTGEPVFSADGLMKRGTIVRLLILPEGMLEAKSVLRYLHRTYGGRIYISIMNQYTPMAGVPYPELARKITEREYDGIINFAIDEGITKAFIQEGGTAEESFIPPFDLTGADAK